MTMRNLLLSFLALGALAIPANAQPPQHGLKTGYIAFTYTGEILPGQMDNFKQVAAKVIAAVAAQEPGTLMYEWSLRADQKTFDAVELYQSSDAVIAHIKHVGSEFGKDLGQVQKELSLVVYGTPNDQAKQALAGLNPVYETPIEGFVR
jgi:quinol monooxygenase YgiN